MKDLKIILTAIAIFFVVLLIATIVMQGEVAKKRHLDNNLLFDNLDKCREEKANNVFEYNRILEDVKKEKIMLTEKLILLINPKVDQYIAKIIGENIEIACIKYELPRNLVIALIARESSFNQMAESSAGAKGLMQVMEKWHKEKIKDRNLFNIDANIDVGCQILKEYLDKEGSLDKALHAYVGKKADHGTLQSYQNGIKHFWVMLEMHNYHHKQRKK